MLADHVLDFFSRMGPPALAEKFIPFLVDLGIFHDLVESLAQDLYQMIRRAVGRDQEFIQLRRPGPTLIGLPGYAGGLFRTQGLEESRNLREILAPLVLFRNQDLHDPLAL